MATAVQRRRGTTLQHSTFTGQIGETTVDTEKKTVVVHDGSTAGGIPLARMDGRPVYVEQYGAKGDGVTNDAAAIQAALNAHLNVCLGPNDYYIGNAQLVITRTGTVFRGQGKKSRLVTAGSPAGGALEVNGDNSAAYRAYATIEDFSIVGGGTVGLRLREVANVDVKNVYVGTGYTQGIQLAGALLCAFYNVSSELNTYGLKAFTSTGFPCNLNQFFSCHFNSNTQTAIRWDEGSGNSFIGCGIEGNGVTGQSSGAVEFLSMCSTGVQPGAIFKSCWFETNHSANAEFYYGGGGGVVLFGNSFFSTDVKYNVQIANAAASLFGNGMNPTLTVGTFGTTSFNVLLDTGSSGTCWNNVAVQVKFDTSSTACFQDTSGRMLGTFNVSSTGKFQFWIDNANHADVSLVGTDLTFNNPVGGWRFKQQLRSDDATNGAPNAGALFLVGGAYMGGDLWSNGRLYGTNGIGAGNTSAGTTLGTVIKKMPIYNTSGTLLGWMPIYDTIT